MTNAAAVIGLTVDGTDVQEDPIGIFLELVRGLNEPPSTRGVDTVVPALAGRIARNRRADRWELELRGYVAGVGLTESAARETYRDSVDQMKVLFDTTALPVDLVAELENGDVATIPVRTLAVAWDQIVPSMARVSVILEAVEDWDVTPAGS